MRGHLSQDTPVDVPAAAIWDVYRNLELARLITKLLSDVVGRVDVVEGDGGVGTLIKITYPPGSSESDYMIEKFIKIDDENRVKETEVIEGGYKALGFDFFHIRVEIVEKDIESSIIRSSFEYEIDDKLAQVTSHVTLESMEMIAKTVEKHLIENRGAK